MSQTITMGATDNDSTALGASSGTINQRSARSFVPSATYTTFDYSGALWKTGSPTDNVLIEVQTDSAGLPSGTSLGTITVGNASLGTSQPSITDYGSAAAAMTSGVTYWLVLERSSTLSDTNRYNLGLTSSGPGIQRYGSGSWTALPNYDIFGTLVLSSATVNSKFLMFM